jgi:hypothetical protein
MRSGEKRMRWKITSLRVVFWLSWSLIVGGAAAAGALAPLGFRELPTRLPPELAPQAHAIVSVLFTLFFERFFLGCALLFTLIALLEQQDIRTQWRNPRRLWWVREAVLLAGVVVWGWLGGKVVPEMAAMVQEGARWETAEVREAFRALHEQSGMWIQVALGLTLLLPWVSGLSGWRSRSLE